MDKAKNEIKWYENLEEGIPTGGIQGNCKYTCETWTQLEEWFEKISKSLNNSRRKLEKGDKYTQKTGYRRSMAPHEQ